ncbi:MAG: acyl CoA:acetate/3-ketoacid CoA transferase [Ruminococcaceae bacterium]|nr:acyl CoA:acetate/3-ketoacid CoA transferase [Oscillospiraceae bacterium]
MPFQILTAREAADLVSDGDTVVTDGFIGSCFPEELAIGLEERFQETGAPRDLTLVYCAGQGDAKSRGLNHLGHEGLLRRVIGGHWNLVPRIQALAVENKVEAYNLPQGVMCHMLRDIAAGRPGTLTHVGLKTFIDPRLGGGKLNDRTHEDLIDLMPINGKDYLFYKTFPIQIAFLRGTYADENGNVTMQHEGLTVSMLSAAQAVRNSGGKVIVQVQQIVKAGTLDPRLVKIPGIYVDAIVVASKPEHHMQTFGTHYNPSFTGDVTIPLHRVAPLKFDERKIICRRAAMEIKKGSIVNLGIGLPEGIGTVANELGLSDNFILTVEAGTIGGVPQSGLDFGCSINPEAIIDQANQFDSYHGGGLDLAFLGLAEVDQSGNINVSKFGTRIPGAGGFIDITQNASTVVFCGTMTAKGLNISTRNGALQIEQEGSVMKFVTQVQQITFSAEYAIERGQRVLYITERAVFGLTPDGLELLEIAPGIDLEKDVVRQMAFKPKIGSVKLMDAWLFNE